MADPYVKYVVVCRFRPTVESDWEPWHTNPYATDLWDSEGQAIIWARRWKAERMPELRQAMVVPVDFDMSHQRIIDPSVDCGYI